MLFALVALSLADAPPADPAAAPAAAPAAGRLAELSLARFDAGDAWIVRDGRGHAIDARTWALLTGDPAVLARIEAARRGGRVLGWALIAGGGAVAASSAAPLLTMEEALAANESTPGFDELGTRNDVRVATAFSLIGAGVLLAGTGIAAHAVADDRALELSRHLDAATAAAAITAYNARLAEALAVPRDPPPDPG